MSSHPQRRYSLEDYFGVEETSLTKHELYRGEIFAMAGASLEHNEICANVLSALRVALREGACRAFGSDLRVATPGELYTYPDVVVVCGAVDLLPDRPDTLLNPVVLVEVLSPATRDYDRGEKFALYQEIPSLREYVLIDQDAVHVERFVRGRGGTWRGTTWRRLAATVRLASIHVALPLSEIYRGVFAAPVTPARRRTASHR